MLTRDDLPSAAGTRPFFSRFRTYLDERFPLVSHSVLVLAFFIGNYLLAQHLAGIAPLRLDWRAAAGTLATWLAFYLLRVFDEFKDAEADRVNHPDRPVPRGLISLGELRLTGMVGVALALGLNLALGPRALLAFCAVLGFAWLMFREFYVGDWLKRDIVLYALTHQVIVPLLCLYAWIVAADPAPLPVHAGFLWQTGIYVGTGLGFEMGRKMRGPAEEKPGEDSYTRYFGTRLAAVVCCGCFVVAGACALILSRQLGFPAWTYLAPLLALAFSIGATIAFCRQPNPATSKQYGLWASMALLLLYLDVSIGLWALMGVQVR